MNNFNKMSFLIISILLLSMAFLFTACDEYDEGGVYYDPYEQNDGGDSGGGGC